jgi:hypothetical protein
MLVIGNAEPLASIAFRSIRKRFSGQMLIGYVDKSDVIFAEQDPLVDYYDLSDQFDLANSPYRGFQDPVFYEIVSLKWELLRHALDIGYDTVIYSDLDVLWCKDATDTVERTFKMFSSIEVLVQSFTRGSELPCLCMGFVALRVSDKNKELIKLCQKTHKEVAIHTPMFGDDEVISQVFQDLNCPGWIRELPQSTFPTGNLYPLFIRHLRFRKMARIEPYIIHLNYVVGFDNKVLLLTYLRIFSFLELKSIKLNFLFKTVVRLIKVRIRQVIFRSN